jgi:hypothetical protein
LYYRWSEYGSGDDEGCGADGGDEHWYMGRTQCFRANTAYSLYGVKSGSTAPSDPCSKKHYMNSFFTTLGVEGFADPLGIDYEDYGGTAECIAIEGDDDSSLNSTSYTTGCSSDGTFVTATFQGLYCSGSYFIASTYNLGSLNEEISELGCYQIHGSSNNGNDDDDNDVAFELLTYSAACSHSQYPNTCPDPHGVKKKRDSRLYKSIKENYRVVDPTLSLLSYLFFIGGFVLLFLTYKMASRPQKRADDPIDYVLGESSQDQPINERVSKSLNRTVSAISQRSQSIKEKLTEYAEELEDDIEPQIGDYQSPEENDVMENVVEGGEDKMEPQIGNYQSTEENLTENVVEEESQAESAKPDEDAVVVVNEDVVDNEEVTKAVMAEKGIASTAEQKLTKHKRPRLAKWSKIIFGKRKKELQQFLKATDNQYPQFIRINPK